MAKKKTSFKEIRSRFVDPNNSNPSESLPPSEEPQLDVSHFNFDVKDPKSIFIAGSPLDSILIANSCKDGGDGSGSGCCGDSGCDSGGASDGGSCE